MNINKSSFLKQLKLVSLSKVFIHSLPHAKATSKSRHIVLSLDNSFVFRVDMQNQLKNIDSFGWK